VAGEIRTRVASKASRRQASWPETLSSVNRARPATHPEPPHFSHRRLDAIFRPMLALVVTPDYRSRSQIIEANPGGAA